MANQQFYFQNNVYTYGTTKSSLIGLDIRKKVEFKLDVDMGLHTGIIYQTPEGILTKW